MGEGMKHESRRSVRHACILVAATVAALSGAARGQYAPIYGGLTYDPSTGKGYDVADYRIAVSDNGIAVSNAFKFVGHASQGFRAVRWDSTGSALELGNLGRDTSGYTASSATSINAGGQIAGFAVKYVSGTDKGPRAVRWDSAGTALELGNLGTDAAGVTSSNAFSINTAGQIAGNASKYVSGTDKGPRAVRWDSAGNAMELGNLGA